MKTQSTQRLIDWMPLPDLRLKTQSFGAIAIESPRQQELSVRLPYEEGVLRIEFKDARAFLTSWDGDPNPYLTFEEAAARPSDMFKVDASRWLSSDWFYLDCESSLQLSDKPWEHFCIISSERSLHVAARDEIDVQWVAE